MNQRRAVLGFCQRANACDSCMIAQDSPVPNIQGVPSRSGPQPPAGPSRTSIPWLIAICAVVAGMVWFTLWQIQSIAIDHARTPEEAAQCIAELPEAEQANAGEHCSTEPNVIFAAQNPVRNTLVVFVLSLAVGYAYLVLNARGGKDNLPPIPDSKSDSSSG